MVLLPSVRDDDVLLASQLVKAACNIWRPVKALLNNSQTSHVLVVSIE